MRERLSFRPLIPTALRVTLLALAVASPASALTIDPGASGLDIASGCGDAACFFDVRYGLDASAPVSGTIDITGGTLGFSIDLASATLSGTDGAVTGVTFSTVTYSGSFAISDLGGGQYGFTDQLATVTGTLTPSGAGSAVALNAAGVNVSGTCDGTPGSSLVCGLIFGPAGFSADVNGNLRYFRHVVDVNAVPEPGTALLVGAGLAWLARRRATH
ncbi:MAG TPA: PEP-CTERM sorting domain-containing protein [Myxococcota bacterium]|nr:PEP-CTERM sorting domain-containing protein [Myxococcales bacterium]HPG27005.1 PEP-CTERM sorting domain-containing protein [Myxococcota bacterium]